MRESISLVHNMTPIMSPVLRTQLKIDCETFLPGNARIRTEQTTEVPQE